MHSKSQKRLETRMSEVAAPGIMLRNVMPPPWGTFNSKVEPVSAACSLKEAHAAAGVQLYWYDR
jgi:hypothetical protein